MGKAHIDSMNYRDLHAGVNGNAGSLGFATTFNTDGHTVRIFHHGSEIARMWPTGNGQLRIETWDHGYGSVTTANRIRQVFEDNNVSDVTCRIKGGELVYFVDGEEARADGWFTATTPLPGYGY